MIRKCTKYDFPAHFTISSEQSQIISISVITFPYVSNWQKDYYPKVGKSLPKDVRFLLESIIDFKMVV